MHKYAKSMLALTILAGLFFIIRWGQSSPAPEIAKVVLPLKPTAPTTAASMKAVTIAAPTATPVPAGDKNEPAADSSSANYAKRPTQAANKAKNEADFGIVELEDGVTLHLTMDTGGTCEIRPTMLPNGNFKLVLLLSFIDTETGEIQIATPSIITPPGQSVWFGTNGKGDDESDPARFGVSFTPKLKSK